MVSVQLYTECIKIFHSKIYKKLNLYKIYGFLVDNLRNYRYNKENTGEKVNLLIQKKDFSQIKRDIETCVGERIKLKANKGRSKTIEREGIIEKSYPCIFVIRYNDCQTIRRISYSYTDVLTNAVEIFLLKDNKSIKVC